MRRGLTLRIAVLLLTMLICGGGTSPAASAEEQPEMQSDRQPLREIHLAIFSIDVVGNIGVTSETMTDQVVTLLSTLEGVKLVNREQLEEVAREQQIALTGLVDSRSAVRLGRFVSAQYVVVGRASRIGSQYYLLLKIVDAETTVQTTVAVKAPVEKGAELLLDRLEKPLTGHVARFRQPPVDEEARRLAELRKTVKPLAGLVLLVSVEEEHIQRPLRDPAAQLAIAQRLQQLGFEVVVPKEPVAGWKESLLKTGRYGDDEIDLLIDGEGTSAFAARLQELTSCRARVELQATPVPGRKVDVATRGVAAGVDLSEALAAKSALEEAGRQAIDELLTNLAAQAGKKNENE